MHLKKNNNDNVSLVSGKIFTYIPLWKRRGKKNWKNWKSEWVWKKGIWVVYRDIKKGKNKDIQRDIDR